MPLFVPLLRLLMLFLNVYDSYKTLKTPPPSARNEGRPSQRALTQRKRDMKGCLAVWIVWTCFMTYEGFVEGLVSLLVPFYDEIKSLGLLFLILTRARGSEPIFLHVIRPLVKPYAPTIDMLLDITRMCGDILFAILAIPMSLVSNWWRKSICPTEEVLNSEMEGSHPTSKSSTNPTTTNLNQAGMSRTQGQELRPFPRKTSSDQRPSHSRRGSSDKDRVSLQSQSRRVDRVGQRVHPNGNIDTHQIWYPPPSAYSDDEDTRQTTSSISGLPFAEPDVGFLLSEHAQDREAADEWRKYPPFPSAYPATPSVSSSSPLPNAGATATRIPPVLSHISEDPPQQDFGKSLLPPRKPLNPSFVDGLSDEYQSPGVSNTRLETMSVDSDSEDDEEDIFNTTLQTPMPPLRATRSGIIPVIPVNREASTASTIASRSSALTTTGKSSSLKTQSSSESISSGALSVSDLSSVLGKKRPLPLDTVDVNRKGGGSTSGSRLHRRSRADALLSQLTHTNITPQPKHQTDATEEDTTSTSSHSSDRDDENTNDKKLVYPKRRKVISSPRRTTNPTRPIRPRITRQATLPIRSQLPKTSNPSSASSSRAPSRSQTRSMALLLDGTSSDASQASVSSNKNNNKAPEPTVTRTTRLKGKSTIRGKSRQVPSLQSPKAT